MAQLLQDQMSFCDDFFSEVTFQINWSQRLVWHMECDIGW
jgi:hypothetical protein